MSQTPGLEIAPDDSCPCGSGAKFTLCCGKKTGKGESTSNPAILRAFQLHQAGQLRQAQQLYLQILAAQPNHADALHLLGVLSNQVGRNQAAIDLIRRALAIKTHWPGAISNLGVAQRDHGRLNEAIVSFRQAIALNPGNPLAHNNLGNAFKDKGQLEEAIDCFRRAIALKPDYPEAHCNLSLALLARGNFFEGWQEHEWRWKCADFPSLKRDFTQPAWDGSQRAEATLLLHAEQGLGDAIQFARYVPLAAEQVGKTIVECPAELQRLFQSLPGEYPIVVRSQPLPAFDLHAPLLSLPRIFKTKLESIPAAIPYFFPDPKLRDVWRQKLSASEGEFRVALNWAGNPDFKADRTRSIMLDRLSPLSNVRGAMFFSVQKGAAALQADHPPAGMSLVNLPPELSDFADTAAAISLMDLVITTDTSVAHLAGALGKPVWVMLQFVPDWRWLLERNDSPWYPTLRLFRQPQYGDWESVVRQVADALAELTRRRGY